MAHAILVAIVGTFSIIGGVVTLSVTLALATGGRFVIAINDSEENDSCDITSKGITQNIESK